MLDVSLGEMPPCDAWKRAIGGGAKLCIGLEGEASGAQILAATNDLSLAALHMLATLAYQTFKLK